MKQITITWDETGECEIHFMPEAPSYRGDRKWVTRLIGRGKHEVAEALRCAAFQMSVPEELSIMLNKELELRRKEDEGEPLSDLRPGDWFTTNSGGHPMIRTSTEHSDGGIECVDTKTGEIITFLGGKRVHVED